MQGNRDGLPSLACQLPQTGTLGYHPRLIARRSVALMTRLARSNPMQPTPLPDKVLSRGLLDVLIRAGLIAILVIS